jgi:hypothetical protein
MQLGQSGWPLPRFDSPEYVIAAMTMATRSRPLEENIDVLNDALDLNLTNVEREHAAGGSAWISWLRTTLAGSP